jgi:hypothetical protein
VRLPAAIMNLLFTINAIQESGRKMLLLAFSTKLMQKTEVRGNPVLHSLTGPGKDFCRKSSLMH